MVQHLAVDRYVAGPLALVVADEVVVVGCGTVRRGDLRRWIASHEVHSPSVAFQVEGRLLRLGHVYVVVHPLAGVVLKLAPGQTILFQEDSQTSDLRLVQDGRIPLALVQDVTDPVRRSAAHGLHARLMLVVRGVKGSGEKRN